MSYTKLSALFLVGLMILFLAAAPLLGAVSDPQRFLRDIGVLVPPRHGVLVGTLVTLVPSSERIVVNTNDQGTVALKLSSSADLRVMAKTAGPEAFNRGDEVVIVVDASTKTVKGVYRTTEN